VRGGTGTGFIIDGGKIITNAHVVSDAIYIEVQKFSGAERFPAKVKYISHCCDLALLEIDAPAFKKNLKSLKLGPLPKIDSVVTTYGYPMGGLQLSVTKGVVSRIEMQTYAHSGMDQHLTIQTDAAINPGNSGGPVIQNGKVIGVAFQGLSEADNVGYMIPSVVIRHFLADIADGKVDDYPDLAFNYSEYCLNPTFRKIVELPDNMSGVVVTKLFPGMPAYKKLKNMDIVSAIDGKKISNDGFVFLDGVKVRFAEVVERMQVGTNIPLEIWRNGKRNSITLKAASWKMPIKLRTPYGIVPKYYIFGGLAFTSFAKGYVSAIGGWRALPLYLKELYISANAKEKYLGFKEFPVLTKILPDKVNVNMEKFVGQVVQTVGGVEIKSLRQLKSALENSPKDLVEVKFVGCDVPLIISKKDALERGGAILNKYHISNGERL
jgi:S1-C subfamily serine protease